MNSFIKYNQHLKNLYSSYINSADLSLKNFVNELDPNDHLRLNENINSLRDSGVFFTGSELAIECAGYIAVTLSKGSKLLDPCCGAGNLLLEVAKHLPVRENLTETLKEWNSVLHGYDLYEDFVEAAKMRIIFQAIKRGVYIDEKNIDKYLSLLTNLKCKNGLDENISLKGFTHIIINPPYNQSILKEYKYWSSGKVNLAAVFIDKYISNADKGLHIVAILPDVLRSGTRYEKWRKAMSNIISGEVTLKGRFDSKTDVDVFIMNGMVTYTTNSLKWSMLDTYSKHLLSDYFSVSIGRVVPYRDSHEGEMHAYLYPGLLKSWEQINSADITTMRRHKGAPIIPPFITIKRTSSPKDKSRAGAHLIFGDHPVYVENHLIIVKPYDNDLDKCKKLLEELKKNSVNEYFNSIIRCRHLTVKAVKEIPFYLEGNHEKAH